MLLPRAESRAEELKRYLRFTSADAARLGACRERLRPVFPQVATEFYERIREHEHAHAVLRDEAQIVRLKESMVGWLERVFGGTYDEAYFAQSERIARVHVKVGLPQRYVPVAMSLLRSTLTHAIARSDDEEAGLTADALGRLLDIEVAIILESYHEELLARIERASATRVTLAAGDPRGTTYEEFAVGAAEAAPMLVVGLTPEGAIALFNREAERTTGYAEDEVLGRDFVGLFIRTGPALGAAGFDTESMLELPMETRSGKPRLVRWRVVRAPNAALFAYGSDVTEERAETLQLQRERQLAAVGTLAAGLAHEIRNPLNGARLHLAYLARALNGPKVSSEVVDAIRTALGDIDRLARLVTEFLEFAQPRPLVFARAGVRAIVERVVRSFQQGGLAIAIELDLPDRDITLEADASRLEKGLQHLVENAIEAIGDQPGRVTVRARREPHAVRIEVEDTGGGIADVAAIFDAFYTTKATGTGLGLAFVHRIISDHGGSITVDSHPGQTRFLVKLPLARQEIAP